MTRVVPLPLFLAFAFSQIVSAGESTSAPPPMSPRQRLLADMVDGKMLSSWRIGADLGSIVSLPTGKGNAADYYGKLESYYTGDRDGEKLTVKPDCKGIRAILAAAMIRDCRLSPAYYPHMETGTSPQPDILVFQAYARGLLKYASALEKREQYNAAARAYRAGLVWGWHLYRERSNLVTMMLGLSIQAQAARGYAAFLRRLLFYDKAKQVQHYLSETLELVRRLSAKSQVLLGDFKNFNCLYATVKIARRDRDYLWRQEAVLRLAVLRHGAPEPGGKTVVNNRQMQQVAAEALAEVAENDPKPWVRKLARWSIQHVTPRNFQDLRHKSLLKSLPREKSESTGTPRAPTPGTGGG